RTGLGRIEIGIADGAGYGLAVTGPKVDAGVSLDDPRTSFFRDPATHRAVTDMFALRTAVGASSNYAKLVYTSPSLFGTQLALSFTPSEGKQFPFLNAVPHAPGRQVEFWDAALRYETALAPVSLTVYGAGADGLADAVSALPKLGLSGLEASIGYKISDSIQASTGWQHQSYSRSSGVFFNGLPQLKMDAIYLHLKLNTSEE